MTHQPLLTQTIGSPQSGGSDIIDIDILGSGSESDLAPSGQEPTELRTDVELGAPSSNCHMIIARAAQALGIEMPAEPAHVPPSLMIHQGIVTKEFAKPSEAHRWSGLCRRLARVHGKERIGCGPAPPMDQALGAFLSPSKSVLGKASCPSKNTKTMDAMLAKLHGAMAVHGQLVNTGAILALYQRQLTERLGESGADTAAELHQVSTLLVKLMKEQATAMGRATASFWVARRHLWLSQSQLSGEDRTCLLQLPIVPSAMFGPNASDMLRQAQEARRCAREASTILRQSRGAQYSRGSRGSAQRAPSIAPDDLRVQLDANRRSRSARDRRSSKPRGRGPKSPRLDPDGMWVSNVEVAATVTSSCNPPEPWETLGAGPWVVSTMTQGYRLQFLRRPPLTGSPTYTVVVDPQQFQVLASEISTLLTKKAIREVKCDQRTGFYSRYFLIPKKDGGLRPILDLRSLNKFLRPLKCKMLTVPRVRQAVLPGDWFATIDLKDAYFQIPIWEGHRRYLRFAFAGKTYEFCVLPFGISLAPRTFTRCMDAVLGPLRQEGLRILNYLDDWLICAHSQRQCNENVSRLLQHLQYLGLRLNSKKSCLVPSQTVEFLGMSLNASTGTLSLTQKRQATIKDCLSLFRLGARVPGNSACGC
ncbi:hypothetical protein WMY93_020385 [Mugilogobius chulae]|uniref:ribonuclease H n=1 Tax=Mugilogobius chulae TaxID=88201 RepID=A0AAW0NRX0_9GOBI